MRRIWAWALALMCMAATALAQEAPMEIFVAKGALNARAAQQLAELIDREYPQVQWTLSMQEEHGEDLRTRVLGDNMPKIVICAPGEALPWAKEGLLAPLTGYVGGQKQMAEQVLSACIHDENLFMAPLKARHRQMAVNANILRRRHMGYLLNELENPVWMTTQFYQLLEELMLTDQPAMEIWKPEPQDAAAIEALIQTIYDGRLFAEDGVTCAVNTPAIRAAVTWLRDMKEQEMIALSPGREAALQRFVAGETALFLDWTQEESRLYAQALEKNGVELALVPYPSSVGVMAHAFELTGAAAFAEGDQRRDALAAAAIAFIHRDEQAQMILGERAIYADDAAWLDCLSASDRGVTLRKLLCDALDTVMDGREEPAAALATVQAMMDAAQ